MQSWLLRNKFFNSFVETESELSSSSSLSLSSTPSGFSDLFSYFRAIKDIIIVSEPAERDDYSEIRMLYHLNDALAEFRILSNECKDELNKKKFLFFVKYTLANYYFIRKMKKRLNTIKLNFERLVELRNKGKGDQAEHGSGSNYTVVLVDAFSKVLESSKVLGFDEQANHIEGLLIGGSATGDIGFKVIGIVGIGGAGKTTLVQQVLRSKRVMQNFSPIISIFCDEKQEADTGIRFLPWILRKLGHGIENDETSILGLGELLERLKHHLSGQRYLIVLDDMWHIDSFFSDLGCYELPEGESFGDCLSHGLPKDSGGTVIVTSRITAVARDMVGENNLIRIKPLDNETCWRIFMDAIPNKDLSLSTLETLEKMKVEIKSRFHGLPLAAKTLAQVIPRRIHEMESGQHMEMDMYIPDEFLIPECPHFGGFVTVPSCPVLVFVDMNNYQIGQRVFDEFCTYLNKNQVYGVLQENSDSKQKGKAENPERVLKVFFEILEKQKCNGDELASVIQKRLRIIAVGGNSVANWILGVICDLKLAYSPPIALFPLETENSFALSVGLGKRNPGTDSQSVKSFLDQVKRAKEMKIDSWHFLMRMKVPNEGACDPIAPLELPHSLHPFFHVSETNELNMEGYHTFRGGFWNYFSMGLDARVSYAFHSERKLYPERFTNQSTYTNSQGWFSASLAHSTSGNIARLCKMKIMKFQGQWQDLYIPESINSIVCLNLPIFSGGFNPWGTPNNRKLRDRDLTPAYVDDALIEVVGFRDAWHGLALLSRKGHVTRLAQVHRIRFEFHRSATDCTYMTIDGKPWKQPLPFDDETVIVEISHFGQVNILATPSSRSKSVNDPMSPSSYEDEDEDSNDEESDKSEAYRKFGAADTFKLPDGIDISHLT